MASPGTSPRGVRILIVDDQPRARQGLRALLSAWPQVAEIREAGDGGEALRLIEEACPDLVLIDVKMPVLDGVEATRRIKERWPQVQVIVLSMSEEYGSQAHQAGAEAFAPKGDLGEQLRAILVAIDSCVQRLSAADQAGDEPIPSPGVQK
jgi:DNA-binding NarL/FixJ family response regulator